MFGHGRELGLCRREAVAGGNAAPFLPWGGVRPWAMFGLLMLERAQGNAAPGTEKSHRGRQR